MKTKNEIEEYKEDDPYHLLRYKKKNEFITRVDRYSIYRYFENEKGDQEREMLFYPSEYGFEQIKNMKDSIMSKNAEAFQYKVRQLIKYGNASWENNVPNILLRKVRKLNRSAIDRPIRKLNRTNSKV